METSSPMDDTSESATHAGDDIATVADAPGTGSRADGNDYPFPVPNTNNNVVHQRRRVNPESLAMRLGPDLVRDLDALITPGNTEMPSFAVRKELQERYNIDRRHIYDYFHSRGLRVVKEDKHGNPLTAKDIPTPLPNLRPLRQAPIKSARSHPPYVVAAERKLLKPRGITKAKPGRPKKIPLMNPKIVPVPTCETDESNESPDTNDPLLPDNSPGEVPTAVYITVNPLLAHVPLSSVAEDDDSAFNSVANPLDESFSVRRAIGDVAYAYRYRPVFERLQEPNEYPLKFALTDDRSLSWNETSPCSASNKGLLLPHAKPLTQAERQAIYESISDSLGPAQGIQECQGTYRTYMQARTKLYFEGLLSVPNHRQPARTAALLDRKSPLGANEFRHWLSETRFLKRDGANGSPRFHTSHRNMNVAKQDVDGADRQISIPQWIPMLDDLFPAPGDMLDTDDTMTDSPVVRRQVAQIATQAQGVPDKCNAGGRLPFMATSTQSLPILPITSVTETQQIGHAELHGHSGFPGTQEIKALMPFSDTERRLQWPEPVSHPGQRPTLNDTRRRGRNMSNNTRICPPSCSPRKPQVRDLDRVRTRPVTSRDARRRTTSAAGGI